MGSKLALTLQLACSPRATVWYVYCFTLSFVFGMGRSDDFSHAPPWIMGVIRNSLASYNVPEESEFTDVGHLIY